MLKYTMVFKILFIFISCIQDSNVNKATAAAAASSLSNFQGIGGKLGLDLQFSQYHWLRGCEARATNLAADSYAWKSDVQIGFINAGSVRHDREIKFLAKGSSPTLAQIKQIIPFGNKLYRIRMNAFRIKQAIEGGVTILENHKLNSATDDTDLDGAQHGNCYRTPSDESPGSGRLLIPSSRLRITVNPSNSGQTVTGTVSNSTLKIANEGNRVTKLTFDSQMLYENSTGNISSGWSSGASSCTVKGISFSQSAACNNYTVSLVDFYADGGDENPSFNPSLLEINNDGTVVILGKQTFTDDEAVFEYMQQSTVVYPRTDGRFSLP